MRSFSFFATFAAAAVSLAAPIVNVDNVAGNALGLVGGVTPLVKNVAPVVRHEQTIPAILVDVTAQISIAIEPLNYITKDNCTVVNIKPVLEEVKVILNVAIKDVTSITTNLVPSVTGILGATLGSVFSLAGTVLSILDIAKIVAALIHVICIAFTLVLKVVSDVEKDVVCSLLAEVLQLLCSLLKIVLPLVGGLVQAVLPLVGDVVFVVKALGVTDLFKAVGLNL
ncbi:hypothetical protein PM082_007249 [Marasmius tenuissimus]|nr:hypothetical protein PM082_007249 [Marasmius tenuissimus]